MFDENFSFDDSRSSSIDSSNSPYTRDTSRSASPCSLVEPYPTPLFSVTDLAAQFADQRIQQVSRICYDSCEVYANMDDDAGWTVEPELSTGEDAFAPIRRSSTFSRRPARPHPSLQRMQRQAGARLLCSATHHRDIAALVGQMVESNDQCSVSSPTLLTPPMAEEQEAYDESTPTSSRRSSIAPPKQRHAYRRPSDTKSIGACVNKNARLRKGRPQHSRTRSSDK